MIRKLQIKLVVLSMSALLVTLSLIIVGINIVNYSGIVSDADKLLEILADNKGRFPEGPLELRTGEKKQEGQRREMSPEIPYESRYFSVTLDMETGLAVTTEMGRIASVNAEQAVEYAVTARERGKERGFIDAFRYIVYEEDDTAGIIFLDCGRKLDAFWKFRMASIGISLIGYSVVLLLVIIFSNRIIRPVSESYEKQKHFITDAGHELKTPLTVIRADLDVFEMENGNNEWMEDIRKQTDRLSALTNDLIFLARMEESAASLQMIDFPLSDVVSEAAASFQTVAQTKGKAIQCGIQPMLSLYGNEKAIRQLVGILLDNALKYSPNGSTVLLSLEKKKKMYILSITNPTDCFIEKEKVPLLFERFYRLDQSHNSRTGGYGIGLSMAKAIVEGHNGRIQAKTEDGYSLQVVVSLPG